MQLVTAEFGKNDQSIQAVTARNATLNKEVEQQRDKITTLKAALENAASSFGESDKRTQNWQIALNKAQAELIGMERELGANNDLLAKATKEQEAAGKASGELGEGTKRAHASFFELGELLKGNVTKSVVDVKEENARAALDQDDYNARRNALLDRHAAATARQAEVEAARQQRRMKQVNITRFLQTLSQQENLVAEFDEELWYLTVDRVEVFESGRLRVVFRDGAVVDVPGEK